MCCAEYGNVEFAEKLKAQRSSNNIKFDVNSYCSLCILYSKVGDKEKLQETVAEMKRELKA